MSRSVKPAGPPAFGLAEKRRFLDLIGSFKKAKILVIGDFILDQFVWGSVDRISPEAPVPVVNVQRESYMPGGSLNVANNIRTLGGTVYPCGVLGRDIAGRMLVKAIRAEGIDTGGIVYTEKGRPTSVKTRVIAHSQQVVRFDREKNDVLSADIQKKILRYVQHQISHADVVILEDYGKGVIERALIQQVVRFAKRAKKPVLVDPKEKNFPYYTGVTAVTPNRKEAYSAAGLAPDAPLEKVGRALLKKWKCRGVLVTLGEGGMALFEKDAATTYIPTAAQEVYDVSGAGDTVIGTFALALAAKASMRDAASIANLAAGIVVGKLGTATVLPKELEAVISRKENGK
jgi:rfaE bifunctional protein kinase chain/domain